MAPQGAKLRDLIRLIREAKTAAEEREVVSRESAIIRTAFKAEDTQTRCRNVAKLLYIHMLGYPAHFGQLECLKLVSSQRFLDKRIGYLGVSLLLDEQQEINLLVTNSLSLDLKSQNQYVQALALSTLGTIASSGMARDVAPEVENLLKKGNAFVRKKAGLCAVRIVRKVPELLENFASSTRSMLNDKNHGVLLAGVTLITEMCQQDPDTLSHFRKLTPNLVRILKNLIMSGFSPEHDVSGVSDPFLQVKVLRLLRLLGRGDDEASDQMNDILAQVATNTESSKNVGNAILYETVVTIMDTRSEQGLRVLAVNILGRFLASSDKNIRYVALNTLLLTVHADAAAVQRHRATVMDCLKDQDVSIRKRALELSFALVNEKSVRSVFRDLLAFLGRCEPEIKSHTTTSMVRLAERYAPNPRWHVDTILKILDACGNAAAADLAPSCISVIGRAPDLYGYAAQRLYAALCQDLQRQPLTQVACWCIGEYGDYLIDQPVEETGAEQPVVVTDEAAVDIIEAVLRSPHTVRETREYALNALMKLSSRLGPAVQRRIEQLVRSYATNVDVELQQRSVEYGSLFHVAPAMRAALLERMPIVETTVYASEGGSEQPAYRNADAEEGDAGLAPGPPAAYPGSAAPPAIQPAQPSGAASDLLDLLSGGGVGAAQPRPGGDVLLDLLGSGGGGGFGSGGVAPAAVPAAAPAAAPGAHIPPIVALDVGQLRVDFQFEKQPGPDAILTITALCNNMTDAPMSGFSLQAAVPKALKLQLMPPSSPDVQPHGRVVQVIRISNPQQKPLKVRLRVMYTWNGQAVVQQGEVDNFPPGCL